MATAGIAAAGDLIQWTGNNGDGLWNEPNNWYNVYTTAREVPGWDDQAQINHWGGYPGGNPDPIIDSNTNAHVFISLGPAWNVAFGPTTLTMTGGTLTVDDPNGLPGDPFMRLGHDPGAVGTWDMSGGIADIAILHVGFNGTGYINLTGGTIIAHSIGIALNAGSSGVIDITKGTLILDTDVVGWVANRALAGEMTAYGGTGVVVAVYDANSNTTTVTADIYGPSVLNWTNTLGDNKWAATGNWDLGFVPRYVDHASIDIADGPVIDSAVPDVNTMGVAWDPNAATSLTITKSTGVDGSLTVRNFLRLGNGAGSSGTINMEAGTLTTDILQVGFDGSGTINLYGGTLNASSLGIALNGGSSGLINITEGRLVIDSDVITEVTNWEISGDIVGYGGAIALTIEYDSLIDKTIVTADCSVKDLTGDCFVNFDDFAVLANDWLKNGQ